MIDYTTQRHHFVEDSLKEMIGIIITSEMKEIMTMISQREDWIEDLNGESKEYVSYYEQILSLKRHLGMLVREKLLIEP